MCQLLFNSSNMSCVCFQEGSITQVACCPHDEDFLAVATRLDMQQRRVLYSCIRMCLILFTMFALQSGAGGGVGAAAGAAGPSGEGQRVLRAPGSGHHCSLLGHQRTQGVCWRLRGQGVISPGRVLQTGQGSDCWTVEVGYVESVE